MNSTNRTLASVLIAILVIVGGLELYNLNKNKTYVAESNTTPKLDFVASSVVGFVKTSPSGGYLTDTKGMTLYTFADDGKLISNCKGDCLKMWPAYMYDTKNVLPSNDDSLSKKMNLFKTDTGKQFAFGSKPVYYYIGDKIPGDTKGNGLDGKWNMVPIMNK